MMGNYDELRKRLHKSFDELCDEAHKREEEKKKQGDVS